MLFIIQIGSNLYSWLKILTLQPITDESWTSTIGKVLRFVRCFLCLWFKSFQFYWGVKWCYRKVILTTSCTSNGSLINHHYEFIFKFKDFCIFGFRFRNIWKKYTKSINLLLCKSYKSLNWQHYLLNSPSNRILQLQ